MAPWTAQFPWDGCTGPKLFSAFHRWGPPTNILIAAVLAEGRTVLHGAAREPEIEDLIRFLNGAGARIRQDPTGTWWWKGSPLSMRCSIG